MSDACQRFVRPPADPLYRIWNHPHTSPITRIVIISISAAHTTLHSSSSYHSLCASRARRAYILRICAAGGDSVNWRRFINIDAAAVPECLFLDAYLHARAFLTRKSTHTTMCMMPQAVTLAHYITRRHHHHISHIRSDTHPSSAAHTPLSLSG